MKNHNYYFEVRRNGVVIGRKYFCLSAYNMLNNILGSGYNGITKSFVQVTRYINKNGYFNLSVAPGEIISIVKITIER